LRVSSSEQWRPITYRRGPSAGIAHIGPTRVAVAGKVVEQNDPKTKAGKRPIPLGPHLVAMLRTAKARQGAEKLLAGEAYSDGGYVAADELGRPCSPGHISVRFKQLAQQAGLPPLRLHDCRHTAASLMLADGEPVKLVSELLGHSSPVVTLTSYAHVMPGQAEAATERLSQKLFG
jgi:integrase